jgi:hypothetical protein
MGGTPPAQLVPELKFKLYIISHDDASYATAKQWSTCKPWAEILRIPSTTFFESIIYKDILPSRVDEWKDLDYVGIATYRSLKFSPLEMIKLQLENAHHNGYDVVPLYTTGEYLVDQAVRGHTTEFLTIWDMLLHQQGFSEQEIRRNDRVEVFLRNSMLIRPAWLLRLDTLMSAAIDTVTNNATINRAFTADAHYRESKFRKRVAQKIFHTDYYQWHPFIFERLPVFFLHHYNASVYGTLREVEWFDFANSNALFKGL